MNINQILADSNWLPSTINPENILFDEISPETLRESAFLDERAKGRTGRSVSVPIMHLLRELPKILKSKSELFEIFHISHVGSTFIARLLDEFGHRTVYREPTILKGLAYLHREFKDGVSPFSPERVLEIQRLIYSLLARNHKKIIIKHSSQNLIIPRNAKFENLEQKPTLYLITSLDDFIAHGISSQGLAADATNSGAARVKSFNSLATMDRLNLFELSKLQRIALVWMSEVIKINSRYRPDLNDCLLDFDKTFSTKKRSENIEMLAKHFEFNLTELDIDKILSSKTWEKDSKGGLEKSYSDRHKKIQKNKTTHEAEIADTINWVRTLIQRNLHFHPLATFF